MEISNVITGVITTRNLNANTAATANSAVLIDCDNFCQMVGVQITGAYTSGSAGTLFGLQAQATIDGTNWVTLPALVRASRNELISNIPNAELGLFYVKNNSYKQIRVCGIAGAATGACALTLYSSNASYPNALALSFGRRWYVNTSGSGIANRANIAAIRNFNLYPIRLESIEICGANNIWAAPNTAQIDGISAQVIVGSTTVTGGTSVNASLLFGGAYTTDAAVQMTYGYTSTSGGSGFNLGSQVIAAPPIGPSSSVSNNSPIVNSPAFLKGLIIPSNSMLLILGATLGSTPSTPTYHVAATLAEVL